MNILEHTGYSEDPVPHDSEHLIEITFEEAKEKYYEQLRELSGTETEFNIQPFFEDYQMDLDTATKWQYFLEQMKGLTLEELQKINPRFKK